jgi:membrane protein implicated in regulation of membrane protease activity
MELWIIWLVAALLLGVGEMHARGFVLAPLALGALVAAGASLAGLTAGLSVIVFLVLSITVLRALRPLALRHQRRPMTLRTGAAALIGQRAVVVERIANDEAVGIVRIDGELWTARSFDDGVVIGAGAVVEVLAIRGATALVIP